MNLVLTAYTLSECMEQMAKYAAAYEKQGVKNLIFCEDRLTLIAERALLQEVGGTFDSYVTTFARFLRADVKTLSKQGSVMAVGDVMTRLQREGKLQCFTSLSGIGNNAKGIYETLAQFSASLITPETLRETAALLPEDMLQRKINDLAYIYEGYLAFLQERGYADESRYLSLLPAYIQKQEDLKDYTVFFLCYTSFTAQAAKAIQAAAKQAKNVIGIFCQGEEEMYTGQAVKAFKRALDGFAVKEKDVGAPLDGEAEALRKVLFNPELKEKVAASKLHIFEADDKNAEAEYVAVKIKRKMEEDPTMRYRDIAVLVPNITPYALPLKKALQEYKIPYFIDEKKSLKQHPLSQFLLSCFQVIKENYSPASVQALAQNLFFGESDEYRNYLLKFANYRGGAKKEIKQGEAVEKLFPNVETLQSGRERLLLATQGIKTKGNGRKYCQEIRRILRDFNAEEKLKSLEQSLTEISQKAYLSQIYDALERVLGEAEALTASRDLTIAEFEEILKDGLEAAEISLIPLKADAVFIGNIADSRIEKVRTLFAVGMTDDVPAMGTDTSIVSDKEIERLAQLKTLLEPTVAEVNLRRRESVCLNLCTFLDELYFTYPIPSDGSEPTTSEIFRYLDRGFINAQGKAIERRKQLDEEDFKYRCSAVTPAVRQLLLEKIAYEQKREDTRETYSSLFSALDKLSVTEKDDYLKETVGKDTIACGEKLFFRDGKISPTAIESYFACPFRHFAERGLKLKNRDEAIVLAVDSGDFIHDLLKETLQKAADFDEETQMRAFALKKGEELLKTSLYSIQQDTASGAYFTEKLLAEGADVAVAAYRQIKNSDFKVAVTEGKVETEEFYGMVDRVDVTDEYVRIIDYKTGKIDDSATSYYTGRKLQLQLYMSAMQGERVPAGVFYFPASVGYTENTDGKFRMQGFLNGDEAALRAGDKNIKEDEKSEYFDAALKNGAQKKKVMDEQTFRDFLTYSTYVARQGCVEMKEGYIAPSPYEGNCQYCKFGGMCGFDKDVKTTRTEAEIDGKTIASITKNVRDGKEG